MRFTVVIPTYKRPDILQRCLQALAAQEFPADDFEVIVVDDGGEAFGNGEVSGDSATKAVIENIKGELRRSGSKLDIRYFWQEHQGQGVARNLGIAEARGEIIVFIGDDIFPAPDFLKEHDLAHLERRRGNDAVLGLVEWHPELTVTPLMRFMTRGGAIMGKFGGHQFAYDLLEGKETADYRFFYTANISLKRSLLLKQKFDPWFSGYGWEDVELGYRLEKREHMKLYYHPKAIGYHYHPMSELDFANRMRSIGASSRLFNEKYPELHKVPSLQKKAALYMLSNPVSVGFLRHMHPDWYYFALSKKYFLEGLRGSE